MMILYDQANAILVILREYKIFQQPGPSFLYEWSLSYEIILF